MRGKNMGRRGALPFAVSFLIRLSLCKKCCHLCESSCAAFFAVRRFAEVIFMFSLLSFVKAQFSHSAKALRRTQTLTSVGILLAIQMLLSSFGVFQLTQSVKISLAHLALAPTAMLFGPVVAGIQGALSDFLGYLLRPDGPYFPGFTLTALLGGVIYGMLLYRTKRSLWQVVLARLLVCIFVNIGLNTVFLSMLYGPAQWAALPLRALKNVLQLPIDCVLLAAVCRAVSRIPIKSAYRSSK